MIVSENILRRYRLKNVRSDVLMSATYLEKVQEKVVSV